LRRILLPVGNLKERRMSDDPNPREEGFYGSSLFGMGSNDLSLEA
jgi:hypothetical protein